MKKYKLPEMTPGMKASFSKEITSTMIADFARLTGDMSPLHTSREFAVKRGYEDIVAHGLLTSSFFSHISGMHLPGENSLTMGTEYHYILPVYAGDTLTYEAEVTEVNTHFEFISLKVSCTNQDGQQVIRGKMRVGVKE